MLWGIKISVDAMQAAKMQISLIPKSKSDSILKQVLDLMYGNLPNCLISIVMVAVSDELKFHDEEERDDRHGHADER